MAWYILRFAIDKALNIEGIFVRVQHAIQLSNAGMEPPRDAL